MIDQVSETAKLITEQGVMVTISAGFLVLSMIAIGVLITYFKKTNDSLVKDVKAMITELLKETRKQNDMLTDISDSLRPELKEKTKVIANVFFDLAVFRVLAFMRRLRKENHIDHRKETVAKIRKWVGNLHSDRNTKFDNFKFRGKPMSAYVNPDWVNSVAEIVEKELYDTELNEDRTFTNIKAVYDDIKLDYYNRSQKL